ncbi:MAG: hypothetical protein BZY87_00535, partial [SAR202 cluster bacterium Io17-Chloro-G6]
MTKTRFLAFISALALLLIIPTVAFAQNARPHVFVGTATLDDALAVDGTAITAWVDGQKVADTNVAEGTYVPLVVSRAEGNCTGRAERNCTTERRGVRVKVSWYVR